MTLKTQYLLPVSISGHRPVSQDPREGGSDTVNAVVKIKDGYMALYAAGVVVRFECADMADLLTVQHRRVIPEDYYCSDACQKAGGCIFDDHCDADGISVCATHNIDPYGYQIIDGVKLEPNVVLLTWQDDPSQNGVWLPGRGKWKHLQRKPGWVQTITHGITNAGTKWLDTEQGWLRLHCGRVHGTR